MSEDAQSLPAALDEAGRLPRLEWIKINRLRHVEPGSKIVFGSNFNVVLGRNGTGKTTLLELISAVVRGNFSYFANEDFDVEYSFGQADFRLDCRFLIRQSKNHRRTSDYSGQLYRAGVEIHHVGNGETVVPQTAEDRLAVSHSLHLAWADWLMHAGQGERLLLPGRLLQHIVCSRFAEGVDVFEGLFRHGADDVVRTLGFSAQRPTERTPDGFPSNLSPHLPTMTENVMASQVLGASTAPGVVEVDCSEMSALAAFVNVSQYGDATLALSLLSSERENWTYGNPLGRFTNQMGDQIPHYQLSFGEKRLLAFLIKLYACPSTIIVDELANGMHHSWIERAVALMEDFDTQSFLSSQDPLLIDCIPLAEDTFPARNTFVLCEISESGQICWRNMTADEAEDFFKSLAVGLERISEIMRSKGLW